MKPAAVKSGYVMNDGNPLYFHEWGTAGAPKLIFIGQLRVAAYNWRPVIERFDDRFHCIALNLRGHGDSGPMLRQNTDVDLWASDIASTVRQLELDSPTVIAFAPLMVGAAVRFAARYPDMLNGLVVIDAGPGLQPSQVANLRRILSSVPAEFKSWDDAVAYSRERAAPSEKALAEERAPYMFRRTAGGPIVWKYDPVLREEYLRPEPPPYVGANPESVWEKVRCPILFLVAQGGSRAYSDESLVKYGDASQWIEVPNCQHYVHVENPDGFAEAVMPFLRRLNGARIN